MNAPTNGQLRIGVYVCHCGTNIAATVDIEAVIAHARELPHVIVARDYKYMCSDPGQELIRQDIADEELNRVVVASCSPLMHEGTFRRVCEGAGLNPFLFQMANIREQCSWVHEDRALATEKAKRLIAAAVYRVAGHLPLMEREAPVNPAALVIGAGIAGIEAALKLADAGKKVYLVEKEPTIGGHMARFDKTFPTLDCAACILTPKMVQVGQHPNIELMTWAEVEAVSGYVGNFKARIRHRARFVDVDKCTGCGVCVEHCPRDVADTFNEGLSTRKAIYRPFPQAVPPAFIIDKQGVPMCEATCPIHTRAQAYVNYIANGNFAGALKVIRDVNPFPGTLGRVCHHPCEAKCQRGQHDEPIAVCALKRFIADWERDNEFLPAPVRVEPNGRRVAVVGSGPAGLIAAYDLVRKGYGVTILEQYGEPGGLLRTGIPEFRLPRDVLDREIDWILDHGVELRLNTALGRNGVSVVSLFEEGFQGVVLALGTTKSKELGIPGEDLPGVVNCLDYLRRANLDGDVETGQCVAVIGGGNAAVDSARTALRFGARKVMILYRRTRAEMPAIGAEIEAAEKEGVELHFLVGPTAMEAGDDGRVTGVKCQRMELGEPDASGRRRPVPMPGEFAFFEADQVILAISQLPDLDFLVKDENFDITDWATLKVDPVTCQTRMPGVFGCGDAVSGPGTVVEAMASGRRAATAMDLYLLGEPLEQERIEAYRPDVLPLMDDVRRPGLPQEPRVATRLNPDAGISRREVELTLTPEEAVAEAMRCLACGGCCNCQTCSDACDAGAIDHWMTDRVEELEVGTIIVATGFSVYDSRKVARYGYGRLPNVVTALEFERLSHASGPTGGRIVTREGRTPRAVGIIHCVGSRDENHLEYCSRVCCMYSLKFAHLVRDKTGADVYNFYIDIRAFGKGYEEFYKRLLNEGVHFIRGKAAEVTDAAETPAEEGKLIVVAEDTLLGMTRRIPVDMVVLSAGLQPAHDADRLGRALSLNCSPGGFYLERHPKLAPVDAVTDGIFLAGACQGPKDIPDAVAQGGAAAAGALSLIDRGHVVMEPITSEIDAERCSGCRLCEANCPYDAITYHPETLVSVVTEELCKGCGTCVASCPSGAAHQKNFEDTQLLAEIEGALATR